ncbi:MAG TPA: hypothetical protein VGD01_16820 [Candidatus Elarobacter sp.]|jgi:hypothetical protein
MDPDDVGLLYVSDDPETFGGHGRLFSARLPTNGKPVRILFDHVNGSTNPRVSWRVIVALVNVSPATTGHLVVAGRDAGPRQQPPAAGDVGDGTNGMHVGHVATADFLKARFIDDDAGEAHVTVAFGQPHVLSSRVLKPPAAGNAKSDGECTAGIFDVQAIEPNIAYELRVMAVDPNSDATVWKQLDKAKNVKEFKARSGVFTIAGSSASETIPFGGTTTFGDRTFSRAGDLDPDTDPEHVHKGEYGVIRHFTCTLATGQTGFLYQSTGSTGATATYVLDDGTLLTSARFGPHEDEDKIVALEEPSLNVTTMAEINSSLAITLRSGPDIPKLADAGGPHSRITVA